jgi:predicted metal-binding protein
MSKRSIDTIHPRRGAPVLICRKCMKRAAHGREIRKALVSELKRRCGDKRERSRLVATGCFDICPKHAVVVASAATLREGAYLLVSEPDAAEAAVTRLMAQSAG